MTSPLQPPSSLLDRLTLWLATGLGVGWLPVSPGTFGSLWGIPIAWGLDCADLSGPVHGLTLLVLLLPGIAICGRAAHILGLKDPSPVVYDELASLPLAFVAVDFTWPRLAVAFVLFRVLDVLKPWPISRLERLPGGLGIMADDALAGLLTSGLLWASLRFAGFP